MRTARLLLLVLVAGTLIIQGCGGGASSGTSPTPTASPLTSVTPSTSQDVARLRALVRESGQPFGNRPVEFTWAHLTPQQLPPALVPADTLGRGLLVALAVDERLKKPANPGAVASAKLLFERGLYLYADRSVPGDMAQAPDAAQWKAEVDAALARNPSKWRTASVNGIPALMEQEVHRYPFVHGTGVLVSWVHAPWTYTVMLEGDEFNAALDVARSLGQ